MLFYDFLAGGTSYKLRLNTRNIVTLEKLLGCNPLAIFDDGAAIPKTTDMVHILYCSLQQYQHGITLDSAFDIFDKYLEDGNGVADFIQVILEVYKVSGLIKERKEEKN